MTIRDDLLSIGAVSNSTGIAVTAVRYYHEVGLIHEAARVGGQRRFTTDVVGRINFIQQAKDVGFSLEEIGQVLEDQSGQWRDIVAGKLGELKQQRNQINAMISLLTEIEKCGCKVVSTCQRADL